MCVQPLSTWMMGGRREEVIRAVVGIEAERNGFLLVTLLGEAKCVEGRPKSVDFLRERSVTIQEEKS